MSVLMLKKGSQTLSVQRALLKEGYHLDDDGIPGPQTSKVLEDYAKSNGWPVDHAIEVLLSWDGNELTESLFPRGMTDFRGVVTQKRNVTNTQAKHAGEKVRVIQKRPISSITGITLHQTATWFNERPPYTLEMHFITTRKGQSQYLNDIQSKMWQAQNVFNASDVGIECDGYYSGVGVDPKYFWKPPSRPDRKPMELTPELVETTRATIQYICEEVKERGGEIKYIHAHRQTSADRTSDPGSLLWQALGVWAQQKLGLSDGGIGWKVQDGKPIPVEWDPRCVGVKY